MRVQENKAIFTYKGIIREYSLYSIESELYIWLEGLAFPVVIPTSYEMFEAFLLMTISAFNLKQTVKISRCDSSNAHLVMSTNIN